MVLREHSPRMTPGFRPVTPASSEDDRHYAKSACRMATLWILPLPVRWLPVSFESPSSVVEQMRVVNPLDFSTRAWTKAGERFAE